MTLISVWSCCLKHLKTFKSGKTPKSSPSSSPCPVTRWITSVTIRQDGALWCLCRWAVPGLCYPHSWTDIQLTSSQLAALRPLCLVCSTVDMGTASFSPLCCILLCIWSWIPHGYILDQSFGDNIVHKLVLQDVQKGSGKQQLSKLFQTLLVNFPLSALSRLMAHAVKCQIRKAPLAQSPSFPWVGENDRLWIRLECCDDAKCGSFQCHCTTSSAREPPNFLLPSTWTHRC